MTEYQFKPGDRVEVVSEEDSGGDYKNGDIFTVARVHADGDLDMVEMTSIFLHPREVRHVTPAPSLITIDRADLPEVKWDDGDLLTDRGTFGSFLGAAHYRNYALTYLAVAEFLDAREAAEKEAAEKAKAAEVAMLKRRDELAERYFRTDYCDLRFPQHKRAIDRIIELEDAANVDR